MAWAIIGIDGGLEGAVVGISQELKLLGWFDMPVVEDRKKTKVKSGKNIGQDRIAKRRRFDVRGFWNQLQDLVHTCETKGYTVMLFLEKARPMPKQGLSSTFQTGRGFGLGEMALAALGRSYQVVESTQWQKLAHHNVTGNDPKARSFTQAARLFPGLTLTSPNGKVPSKDGRADASLIAYYGLSTCFTMSPVDSKKPKRVPLKREAFWNER